MTMIAPTTIWLNETLYREQLQAANAPGGGEQPVVQLPARSSGCCRRLGNA
jgi:hypothetical protein